MKTIGNDNEDINDASELLTKHINISWKKQISQPEEE